MTRAFHRLLRLRVLLEELSELELEKHATQLRRLETAVEQHRASARAVRGEAVQLLMTMQDTDAWQVGVADVEVLGWKAGKLQSMADSHRPDVEVAREDLLARRLERRQVETLAAAAARTEEKERVRREQKQIDDWFQSRVVREKRDRREE